jgi:hypothetical protein
MVLEIAFWLLYLAAPPIIVFLLKLARERVNRVSLVNIVALSIYAFSIFGTMPLFYHWDEYRVATGVVDQELIFVVLLYSSINLIVMLLGVIFARNFVGLKGVTFSAFTMGLGQKQILVLFVLCAISTITLFFYISKLDNIALFVALESGAKEAGSARSSMGNDFVGTYHWYQLFMYEVSQFVAYTFFANWLVSRTKQSLVYFSLTFFVAAFIAIMATEKAPIAWFLIGLFFVYVLTKRDGIIPIGAAMKFSLIVVGVLMLMYTYFMGSTDLESALSSVFSRALTGGITPAYFYLEYFPNVKEYLVGGTFPNPGGVLPFTPFRYTVELANWVFPDLEKMGVVGSMPTVFWGESYANFGPLGIPIVAFFVGILLATISWIIAQLKSSPVSIALLVWATLHYKDLAGSGFSGFLADTPSFVIFWMCFLIVAIGSNVRRKVAPTQIIGSH